MISRAKFVLEINRIIIKFSAFTVTAICFCRNALGGLIIPGCSPIITL